MSSRDGLDAHHALVNEIRMFSVVQADQIGLGLPMRREDDDGLWLDLLRDLTTDLLKHGIHRMVGVVLDAWLWKDCQPGLSVPIIMPRRLGLKGTPTPPWLKK